MAVEPAACTLTGASAGARLDDRPTASDGQHEAVHGERARLDVDRVREVLQELVDLLLERFLAGFRHARRWLPWVNRISGALLVGLGLLMITGSFTTPPWTWPFTVSSITSIPIIIIPIITAEPCAATAQSGAAHSCAGTAGDHRAGGQRARGAILRRAQAGAGQHLIECLPWRQLAAPIGAIMNSWTSTLESACAPPLTMLSIGTGSKCALGPPR